MISKKENNYIFQKKIISTTQKRHNFACENYIFPKTRANKNKQWAHLGAPKETNFEIDTKLQVLLMAYRSVYNGQASSPSCPVDFNCTALLKLHGTNPFEIHTFHVKEADSRNVHQVQGGK